MAVVAHAYKPRAAFMPFHASGRRFSLIVAHRRAGKTVAVVNHLFVRALRTPKKNARYAYLAPTYGQAKATAWLYIKQCVQSMPAVKVSESETSITLPNGSYIRIFGVDNADALRGQYFDGIVCDEFGDWPGRTYTEVIRPALSDREGWAIFLGTPRGKNKFYELRNRARDDTTGLWFYCEIKSSVSGILPQSELDAARLDMDEDEFNQEFECSFDATVRGSYYSKHILALEARGRVKHGDEAAALYDSSEPVHISHDPGANDTWAIWFWQIVNGEIRYIDYWEETGYDVDEVIEVLQLKPYSYETWWVPHDALHKTARSKKSILDVMRQHDAPARKVPDPDGDSTSKVKNGIGAVRQVLRTYPVVFDGDRCKRGLECLKNYSRKWNADTKVFSERPDHDHWSNGADSFRYSALTLKHEDIQRSVQRYQNRRSQALLGDRESVNTGASSWTLKDAFSAHDRRLKAQRAAGRQRI